MGTRSLTVIKDERDREIVVMYRQFDGYPSGHGLELRDFLKGIKLVNGIGENREKIANGMGCLAAQIIRFFKEEVGQFYLHPAGTRDCWEDYIYTVYPKNNKIYVRCETADHELIYDGLPSRWKIEED